MSHPATKFGKDPSVVSKQRADVISGGMSDVKNLHFVRFKPVENQVSPVNSLSDPLMLELWY
jgi:hypothetical protein